MSAPDIPRRWREMAARAADRAADRLHPYWTHHIRLESAPSARPQPRYGHGRPPHAGLEAYLARHGETYRAELAALVAFRDDLVRIPRRRERPGEPCWDNAFLLGLDTVSLYGYVRRRAPARYVEIGSGNSTTVVARARADGALGTRIVSIDPRPRAEVDALCDEVVRQPLELVDLARFAALEPGDMVFVDASHRVFTNSDMVAFYLDVLPSLPSGVLVGIHDILWPEDYLPEWSPYWFSEQYLLAAYLLGGGEGVQPVLPCHFASGVPELAAVLEPLWREPALAGVDRRGFCFWFGIDRGRPPGAAAPRAPRPAPGETER